jgi:uncharacterized C2H2 Zn-finger protein
VCMEDKPVEGCFTSWSCNHRVCAECMPGFLRSKVGDGDMDIKCPHCNEALTEQEVIGVLRRDGASDLADQFVERRTQDSFVVASEGVAFCRCPRCDVTSFLTEEEARGPGFRAICGNCETPYCSACVSDRHLAPRWHYFATHAERNAPNCTERMRQKEAAWLQWRAEGQSVYVRQMQQVDAEYSQQLQAFEKESAASRQAYEAFQQDEQAKAGWVHCPYCNALWEGSDACPQVTCGVLEARMGERRAAGVGCGRQFRLTDAPRYRPVVAPPPAVGAQPAKAAATVHDGIRCDGCGVAQIEGLRIRCLHCPAYNLCLPCLARDGPGHAAEEVWPGRGRPHVFEVLHEPVPEE